MVCQASFAVSYLSTSYCEEHFCHSVLNEVVEHGSLLDAPTRKTRCERILMEEHLQHDSSPGVLIRKYLAEEGCV